MRVVGERGRMVSRETDTDTTTRRRFLKGVGGGAAATTLLGTTSAETSSEAREERASLQQGAVLTYARGASSESLDPQNTTSGESVKVTNQIYDTLIDFEPNQTSLQAGLATDWSLDGTTATLTLREGVTFHNGAEFTADDFIATWQRFTNPDSDLYPGQEYISAYGPFTLGNWVADMTADGDYNLTIELQQQYAPFLRNLAMFASSVLSRQAIEELGTDLAQNPVGTGPFQFENWDTGNQRIRLSAYDDYWGDGPNVDEVVFTVVGQNTTRAQTLATGDADIIDGLGAQSSTIVNNADNAELVETQGINIGYLAFNIARREEFQDRRVRQAISYAINTQAIVETIFQGIAVQASQPIPEQVLGYNEELDPYPHDPEQAQTLLEEAGYGDGFEFELATFQNPRTYNPSPIQAAETVRSNLNEVGLTVTVNQQPFNPFLEYTANGQHDACFLGWMTDNGDPDNFYYALLHPGISQDEVPEGQNWVSFDTEGYNTSNRSGWANTEFMQVIEEGQSTYGEDQRAELYRQAGQIAHEEAPWVFMDHAKELRGVSNRVSGFQIAPISGPLLHLVSLDGGQ